MAEFNLGNAHGTVTIDGSQIDSATRRAVQNFDNATRTIGQRMQGVADKISNLGRSTTLALSPITAFVTGGILTFAKFDDVLTEIEARTGATAEQMEAVRAKAIQMGQETAFSATQAGDAMLQLLSSGYDLTETFTALPAVLNLAAAGNLDLGYAADATTDILAQFRLGADSSIEVVDALNKAAGASSATIEDMIGGFSNVGPVAANFGMSIFDTAAALAVLSENGIKAEEGGTALRSMLNHMADDTGSAKAVWEELGLSMYDASGNARNLDDIIDDLNVAMDDMSEEERNTAIQNLAGTYGQMALSALLASDGIDGMTTAMDEAADAETVAAARMSSFRGVVNQLKSSIQTLSITVIGPLADKYLKPVIQFVTQLINKFIAWTVANPELAEQLGILLGVLGSIGPVLWGVGRFLTMFIRIIGFLTSPISLLIGLIWAIKNNFLGIRDALEPIFAPIRRFLTIIHVSTNFLEGLRLALRVTFGEGFSNLIMGVIGWVEKLLFVFRNAGLGEAVNFILESLQRVDWIGVGEAILRAIGRAIIWTLAWVNEHIAQPLGAKIREWVESGQVWEDVQTLGRFILDALRLGLEAALGGLTWVADNIIIPIGQKIAEWVANNVTLENIQTLGGFILDALRLGLEAYLSVGNWIFDNIITPIGVKISEWVKSGAAWEMAQSIGGFLLDSIAAGFQLALDLAGWINTNIIQPLGQKVSEWVSSGQIWTDIQGIGAFLLKGIAEGFSAALNIGEWIVDNIITPIGGAVKTWIESGQIWTDIYAIGGFILEGIGVGFIRAAQVLGGLIQWVWDNILRPIGEAILGTGGGGEGGEENSFMKAVYQIGAWIIEGVATGFIHAVEAIGGFIAWVFQYIIFPIGEGILGNLKAIGTYAAQIGQAILDGIVAILGDMVTWANDHIVQPILDAIDDAQRAIDDFLSSVSPGRVISNAIMGEGGDSQSAEWQQLLTDMVNSGQISEDDARSMDWNGPGGQAGIPWTGSGPLNEAKGVYHAREAVVPHEGMSVVPDPRGLQLRGLGGLMADMARAMSAQPLAMPAAVGAGGDNYITVSVPVDPNVLRNEPQLIERARQFGQIAGDSIMDKIRGRGGRP